MTGGEVILPIDVRQRGFVVRQYIFILTEVGDERGTA
jgi:hypothetical protein